MSEGRLRDGWGESDRSPEQSDLQELPDFEFDVLADERDNPSEFVIYDDSGDKGIVTHWITIDTDSSISLEECL